MDRRKKKSFFLIVIFVLVIMLAAIFGSYALWQKVKKQKNKNVVGTACLNVTFSNESGNISFDNAYPVTDAEGASGTPYTFTLTNECDEEVNYVIGLESIENGKIESSEYLDSSYIKVKLDDDNANNYSNYGAISDDAMADYNIRETKGLNHHTLAPHETATHEIRMWIDENTPMQNEDQSYNTDKYFFGKIRIIAGQNIEGDAPEVATDASCFSFDSETGSITGYTVGENCPTDVVIPSKINSVKVKTIGQNAFANSGLTSVTLPAYVTTIEENAFSGNQLTNITISKKVTTIGNGAFANNAFTAKDDVTIESNEVNLATRFDSNWMEIGFPGYEELCFTASEGIITDYNDNCSKNVVVPSTINNETITSIAASAFASKGLTSVVISNTITTIGDGAFNDNQLTSVTIPANVETIGDGAFSENDFADLSAITIEDNDTNAIDRFNESWTTIGFPGSGPVIVEERPTPTDESCFTFDSETATITGYDKTCGGTDVVIPDQIDGVTVTTIGNAAFKSKAITSVFIPYSVEAIAAGSNSAGAFSNNSNLTTVVFENTTSNPSRLKLIGASAFRGSTSSKLTGDLVIPASVETIGNYAFYLTKYSTVTFENTQARPSHLTSIGIQSFAATSATNGTISGQLTIPSSVTSIGNSAFAYQKLTSLIFEDSEIHPSQLTSIGTLTFRDNSLTSLTVPASVAKIGGSTSTNGAFLNNSFESASDITIEYNETNKIGRFNSNWTNIGFPGSGPTNPLTDLCFTFVSSTGTITDYDDDCPSDLVIPSTIGGTTVTTIGEDAFYNKRLTSVTIPASVTTIKSYAFYNNKLTNVTIPANVSTIEDSAFYNNQFTNTDDIIIEYNSTNIETRFDSNWKAIGFPLPKFGCYTVGLHEREKIVGYDSKCSKDVVIPSTINNVTVTTIGEYAFLSKGLTSVTIPASVTTIENSAFSSNQLTNITIPANVTEIKEFAFDDNQFVNADDITIEYNDINIETRFDSRWEIIGFPPPKFECYTVGLREREKIVDYDSTCSKDVVIPNTINNVAVTEIGNNAFKNKGLTSVTIPASVTTIGNSAFSSNQLISLTFENTTEHPSYLTIIGQAAFYNNQLTNVTIPASVTTIENSAFSSNQLISLTFENTTEHPSHLITIREKSFYNNQLTNVTIPASVTSIEYYAFNNNQFTNVDDITIEYNDLNIETRFDSDWQKIGFPLPKFGCYTVGLREREKILDYDSTCSKDVVIPNTINNVTVTEIGNNAFKNKGLTSVTIPYTVTTIEDGVDYNNAMTGAFSNNSNLTTVVFENTTTHPSQLSTIGDYSFSRLPLTGLLEIPSSVATIGERAFSSTGLTGLIFEGTIDHPGHLSLIKQYAFYGTLLTNLTLPNSVNPIVIEEGAFGDSQISGTLVIPSSVIELGNGVFINNQINNLVFEDTQSNPSQLSTIFMAAFQNNQITGTVVIPSSVTYIGAAVFNSNSNLNKIVIKRADSTGMTLGSGWSYYAYVVYDPNYEE